jgi:hypothetical protein
MQCKSKTRHGSRCKARALVDEDNCAFHRHPGLAAELGSKGGRGRAVYSVDVLKQFDAPRTAADLRDLLAQSIVEIRGGKLDPKLANSISYLGMGFLRALETSDLESRLVALERHYQKTYQAKSESEIEPANNIYAALFAKTQSEQLEKDNETAGSPEAAREIEV